MLIVGGATPVTLFGTVPEGRRVMKVPHGISTTVRLGLSVLILPPLVMESKKLRASAPVPGSSRIPGEDPGFPAVLRLLTPFEVFGYCALS